MRWPVAARPRTPDPAHAPLLDAAAIAALYQLASAARAGPPRVDEVAHRRQGDLRSPWRGSGLDYEESRPYQPGDETRLMNWRALARTGEPHVKVFRREQRSPVFVLVDRRAAMRFGTRVRLKAAQAARAAALLAFAAQVRHTTVAGAIVDDDLHWIAPALDAPGVFDLVRTIAAPCPPVSPARAEPALPGVLRQLAAALERGTTLYLVSDFIDLDAACQAALFQLARDHQPCALHVIDPAEELLPAPGRVRLLGCGDDDGRTVDTADPLVVREYASAAARHRAQREQWFAAAGIPCLALPVDLDRLDTRVPLP